jgi:hypothetical protein
MQVQTYKSLFNKYKGQPVGEVFAHFHPDKDPLTGAFDFDAPFKKIAAKTLEGPDAWDFTQAKYQNKYHTRPPKLRNYLLYTFARLRDLELSEPGRYFLTSDDGQWSCFNSGLQDKHSADLFMIFERYQPLPSHPIGTVRSDWVYRGTVTSREQAYRSHFGTQHPALAWYSNDSEDYIFNTQYTMDTDIFDHMFDRAKERSGFAQDASDESVRNYLRGCIENLIPKIRRNYKTAIPVYFIEERRMQMLLPFHSSNGRDISCFLVERDDVNSCYKIKTILDMDQAFFAARLITRPDKEWLNP